MRVPGIALWEGKIQPGTVCQTPVSVIDVQRTFFSLANHSPPSNNTVDGQDISNLLLKDNDTTIDRPLFYYGAGRNKLMAVRKGPWKLHIHTSSQLGEKYFDKEMPLLFNLDEDPSEKYELSEKYPEIVNELLKEIELQKQYIKRDPSFFEQEAQASKQKHLAYDKKVILKNDPSEKYGTADALTDGYFKQAEDYHLLPGFHGTDMEAIIDLGEPKSISTIEVGFLEVHNSWIFLPRQITFFGSSDGKHFVELGNRLIEVPQNSRIHQPHYFNQDVDGSTFRWIKVVAKNINTCPDWHYGKGQPAWIFPDEIVVL